MIKPLSFFLLLLSAAFPAQEGYIIKMQVHMEGLPPEYAGYGDQEITTYVKGDKSRTEVNSVMYTSMVYYDGDTLTMLNDVMGNKQAFKAGKKELEESDNVKNAVKPTIRYTKETKNIAGYSCTKAVISAASKKGDTSYTVAWVTEKIKTSIYHRKAAQSGTNLGDLKGFPLEMEIADNSKGNNITILMSTKEVQVTPLADSVFKAKTAGFQVMSYKEWQEQRKKGKN